MWILKMWISLQCSNKLKQLKWSMVSTEISHRKIYEWLLRTYKIVENHCSPVKSTHKTILKYRLVILSVSMRQDNWNANNFILALEKM